MLSFGLGCANPLTSCFLFFLQHLQPGMTYNYQVQSDDQKSQFFKFKAMNDSSVSFVSLGLVRGWTRLFKMRGAGGAQTFQRG